MGVKSVKYDYDLILYYFNAFKVNKRPSCDLVQLLGMKKYIEENNVDDEVLIYMIGYVIDKIKNS